MPKEKRFKYTAIRLCRIPNIVAHRTMPDEIVPGRQIGLMVTQGVLALSEAFGLFRKPDSSRVSDGPKRLIKADGIPGSWPCHSSTCCINSDGRCRTPATHGPQQFLRRNAGATAFGTAGVHAGKDAV
ncbi:MAG: hypothetical protein E5X21_00015 [Mesorhizobium sp.]|nr:hypothetical protein EOA31_04210 [Mesorhizobium sp. M4B.F.Ca.ET.049.02.1.2]RUX55330.1 hypothetical protein EN994_10455 [Mesorhizobium sp. M7A.F.Ca.CA.002.09.1.1]RUX68482.1 hypothetical protein EOA22_01485 [Mesorhizobium sp. M7A.F.Ca.US.014.04.1.1]RUZ86737.1 hypothetical protein EN942_10840 [Mesorhizobium sp. M7A.F.Ca.CA.001.14.1.1]RVA56782.1 hypothetical protein EN933_05460 [Mesorhizobium sp. M7A.F.Ca.US.001.01.1.1]RVB49420.1 hypothetical protein EN918_00365 [Mesorhizobium sp. M7A.F.Ca.CA.0